MSRARAQTKKDPATSILTEAGKAIPQTSHVTIPTVVGDAVEGPGQQFATDFISLGRLGGILGGGRPLQSDMDRRGSLLDIKCILGWGRLKSIVFELCLGWREAHGDGVAWARYVFLL